MPASFILSLSACITLSGHRQIIDEDEFFLKITAPNKLIKHQIRFNPERTDLVHLPEGARIELVTSDTSGRRQLIIKRSGTSVIYNYRLNGRKTEFGTEEREWFASQLPKIISKTSLKNASG